MICKTIVTSYKFQKTSKLELETRPTITAIALQKCSVITSRAAPGEAAGSGGVFATLLLSIVEADGLIWETLFCHVPARKLFALQKLEYY